MCVRVKLVSWKWATSKFAHQVRAAPCQVLRQWATKFAAELDPEGLAEIETALALHPNPPVCPPFRPGSAPPTAQDLPPPGELERCRSVGFWLGQASPTQRTIPKSTLTNADQVCAHTLKLLHDPALSDTHRRVLLAMALTMPRWLWPEPGKRGQHLPPNSRPQLMKERANAFLSNDWSILIHAISHDTAVTDPPPSPARTPGVLTEADHRKLLHAARQERLTAAWRQLYSYGVAAATEDTQRLLEQKWLPVPAFPAERRGHHLIPADATDLIHHAAVLKASSTLPHGSTTDALGWTHEAWQTLYRQPHGQKLLKELQVLFATGALGREATDIFNSCLAILFQRRRQQEAERQTAKRISFGDPDVCEEFSAPEKGVCGMFEPRILTGLQDGVGQGQAIKRGLAVGLVEGIVYVCAQVNLISGVALPVLAECHGDVAAAVSTHGCILVWSGGFLQVWAKLGHTNSRKDFAENSRNGNRTKRSTVSGLVAYADDALLVTPIANAARALQQWQNLLRPLGPTLNLAKLEMWNPDGHAIPADLQEACPDLRVCEQGFRICGLPLDKVDDLDPLADQPWGSDTFTERFLQQSRDALQARLRVLAAFVIHHGPHTEALHIALHILRVNLCSRCVHLYRFCPRSVIHDLGSDTLLETCMTGSLSSQTFPSVHRRHNSFCTCHALMVALVSLTLSTRLLFTFFRLLCLLLTSCQRLSVRTP